MEILRESVLSLKIADKGSVKGILTISLGGYIVDCESNDSFDEAYRKADEALYLSKASGRDQYHIYKD